MWGIGQPRVPLVRDGAPLPAPWPPDVLRLVREAAGDDVSGAWCVLVEATEPELEARTLYDSSVIGFRHLHNWRDKLRTPGRFTRSDIVQFGGAIDINVYTGFAEGDEFCSELDVRSYFRVAMMRAMFGRANDLTQEELDLTQEELDLMAEVLLELRLHCAF